MMTTTTETINRITNADDVRREFDMFVKLLLTVGPTGEEGKILRHDSGERHRIVIVEAERKIEAAVLRESGREDEVESSWLICVQSIDNEGNTKGVAPLVELLAGTDVALKYTPLNQDRMQKGGELVRRKRNETQH